MRHLFAPALLLLLATSCNSNYDRPYVTKETGTRQTIRFMELSYGIGKPNADHSDFIIKKETDTIPVELGKEFGVRYSLESNLDAEVMITTAWTFPDSLSTSENETRHIHLISNKTVQPNDSRFSAYMLEETSELLPGKWLFSVYYRNKLLYRKVFFLRK